MKLSHDDPIGNVFFALHQREWVRLPRPELDDHALPGEAESVIAVLETLYVSPFPSCASSV